MPLVAVHGREPLSPPLLLLVSMLSALALLCEGQEDDEKRNENNRLLNAVPTSLGEFRKAFFPHSPGASDSHCVKEQRNVIC